MKIGIIATPKAYKRRFFLKKLFGILKTEDRNSLVNPFELAVCTIFVPDEKLKKMTPERIERILFKAKNKLMRFGAEKVVYTEFIKNLCIEKRILRDITENRNGDKLFLTMMPKCIRETAKKCGMSLIDTGICIRTDKAGRISEYFMKELCFDTKTIVLCSKNKEESQKICDAFFEETGLLVRNTEVYDDRSGIVVDTDQMYIRFGKDLYVNDMDMGFELYGYDIKHREIAAFLKGYKPDKIKWKYSYGEKL